MIGIGTSGSASFGVDWYASAPAIMRNNRTESVRRALRIASLTISMATAFRRCSLPLASFLIVSASASTGVDHVAFRHQILAGDDDARVGRDAAEHQPVGVSSIRSIGKNTTLLSLSTARMPRSPAALSVTTERGRITASAGWRRTA